MITIDGSEGEGGGQILRTSLALSLMTGKPFWMSRIRARRKTPGLLRQHLTAVQAAARVGCARVEGATLGSEELIFEPSVVQGGTFEFTIGSAGSTMLVLQTVLPALLCASGPSELLIEGGTHARQAPSFEFITRAFLPLLRRMGANVEVQLERPGFYPAGGGRIRAHITPCAKLERLDLRARGALVSSSATACVSQLPGSIAERELAILAERLGWPRRALHVRSIRSSLCPGNVLTAELESEHVTEVFTGFGERGRSSEQVASAVADEIERYLASDAPVGEHLADQLLLPMAMSQGGAFRTLSPTAHTKTQADTIRLFLDRKIIFEPEESGAWSVFVE